MKPIYDFFDNLNFTQAFCLAGATNFLVIGYFLTASCLFLAVLVSSRIRKVRS